MLYLSYLTSTLISIDYLKLVNFTVNGLLHHVLKQTQLNALRQAVRDTQLNHRIGALDCNHIIVNLIRLAYLKSD